MLGGRSPEGIQAFGKLVSSTLKDVTERGAGVDPFLRYKLADMADDVVVVARDIEDRKAAKAVEEAEA